MTLTSNKIDLLDILPYFPGRVFLRDINGAYKWCNKEHLNFLSVNSLEEIIGKRINDLHTKIFIEDNFNISDNVIINKKEACYEEVDGYLCQKSPIFNNNGDVIGIWGQVLPSNASQELSTIEEILAIVPGHLYWKNKDCLFEGCNEEHAKNVGLLSRHEIKGKSIYDIISNELSEEERRSSMEEIHFIDRCIMKDGIPRTVEENAILPDGREVIFLSKKVPLFDREGNIKGVCGTSIDITELRQLEKLAEHERLAKEAFERSNDLKTNFLANMSHDMRTPLNIIYGYAQLLRMGTLTEEKKEKSYQLIEQGCESLLHLINDIIDISKIELNQLRVVNAPINLTHLMQELYAEFEDHSNKTTLLLDIPCKESFFIITDGLRLKQIFTNLLSNAHEATPKGKIAFGYKYNDNQLNFFVKDNGKGIPDKVKHLIFKRFTKIEPKSSGSGIGLAISHKLVKLLGGKISFESKENIGTSFKFSIPLVRAEVYKSQETTINTNKGVDWDNHVILIVEDIPENYEVLKELITKTNVKLLWAVDGKSAIELFKNSSKVDLVLLDIGLPDIDGYEVLKGIRNISTNIPVIAQTAYAMIKDREKFIQLGFDDFVTKPIDAKQLINTIDKHLTSVATL